MRFVEANGLELAFLEEGEGPLVLMLHGFPDTAHTWDKVRPLVAKKGYRAVSPFLRGYRPSAIPTRDADLETLGRDVVALIGALGAEQAIVIGHDWGAAATYAAAALAPERISRLIALAVPHPFAVKPSLSKIWGVRHFFAYKLRGAPSRFARDDFAALPKIYRRWSPTWNARPRSSPRCASAFPIRPASTPRSAITAR
jgi:pimeloyl-ACP methyl ester carboxylesterase